MRFFTHIFYTIALSFLLIIDVTDKLVIHDGCSNLSHI